MVVDRVVNVGVLVIVAPSNNSQSRIGELFEG